MSEGYVEAKIVEQKDCDLCILHQAIADGHISNEAAMYMMMQKTRTLHKTKICDMHFNKFQAWVEAIKTTEKKITSEFEESNLN
jgi:hypothetical protein